jgi:probable HAF family extracellular repeat protein
MLRRIGPKSQGRTGIPLTPRWIMPYLFALLVICLCVTASLRTAPRRTSDQHPVPEQNQNENISSHAGYELVDVGAFPRISDDVAPHVSPAGEISWWQTVPGQTIHAFVWTGGSLRDIGTLKNFASSISSHANAAGEVIGWSVTSKNLLDSLATTHAFLFTHSAMIDLGTLGGRDSKAMDINAAGQVVGLAFLPDNRSHAFLYQKQKLADLGTLSGGGYSAAYAINNRELIAGVAETSSHLIHAALWSHRRITDLGTLPGGMRSRALALNDRGDVVGFSEAAGAETHAFLYAGRHMQDLGSLGSDPVRANAINSHRQVVGASGVTHFARHAFIWERGTMQDLNKLISPHPAWLLEEAYDITDRGEILCLGTKPGLPGDRHLLLLKPSPKGVQHTPYSTTAHQKPGRPENSSQLPP